jgi:acetyl esterase/lipase
VRRSTRDSIEYKRQLERAGVAVEMEIIPGMFHGFWRMGDVLAQARRALYLTADRIRRNGV